MRSLPMMHVTLFLALASCARERPQAPPAPERHAHGPLVHRFEHADRWAPVFDDPARDATQRPQEVIDLMQIAPGMTVVDLGAGTGYFEPWLSRAVGAEGAVLALDVEPDMVRYLTERATREKLANVHPQISAMDDPKLVASSVDRVLIADVWHHIDAREAYATKLARALKPGGKICVVDFTLEARNGPPPHHRVPAEVVVRELAAAGLDAAVVNEGLPDHYVVAASRR